MTDQELKELLDKIAAQHTIFDTMLTPTLSTDESGDMEFEYRLRQSQLDLVRNLFDLFSKLRWQLSLNSYRRLDYEESPAIQTGKCGTAVRVRPAGEQYGNKTYFGILIGEVPLTLSSSIDSKGNLTISRSMYNPAIFVPALGEIIYGIGSWWSELDPDQEVDPITDEMIGNVWYMKLMREMAAPDSQV